MFPHNRHVVQNFHANFFGSFGGSTGHCDGGMRNCIVHVAHGSNITVCIDRYDVVIAGSEGVALDLGSIRDNDLACLGCSIAVKVEFKTCGVERCKSYGFGPVGVNRDVFFVSYGHINWLAAFSCRVPAAEHVAFAGWDVGNGTDRFTFRALELLRDGVYVPAIYVNINIVYGGEVEQADWDFDNWADGRKLICGYIGAADIAALGINPKDVFVATDWSLSPVVAS